MLRAIVARGCRRLASERPLAREGSAGLPCKGWIIRGRVAVHPPSFGLWLGGKVMMRGTFFNEEDAVPRLCSRAMTIAEA